VWGRSQRNTTVTVHSGDGYEALARHLHEVGAQATQTRHGFPSSLFSMDEARRVIERLERIDALDRASASPADMLAELRGLLHDAEAWVRVEGGDAADDAVIRLREALARDAVPA
jgi:hypothetical protein